MAIILKMAGRNPWADGVLSIVWLLLAMRTAWQSIPTIPASDDLLNRL